ncbi:A-kinase anchor protein 14-like [Homalodisca vitripennis]|uniref:A-kinase anchor protein 14-like n=2 Tax=Homalodisca vitripennis TaxID=197043 RepID=UPI001EEA4F86|nr:A-kinase anchor protein 14-like [Homalodisca vitripennis]
MEPKSESKFKYIIPTQIETPKSLIKGSVVNQSKPKQEQKHEKASKEEIMFESLFSASNLEPEESQSVLKFANELVENILVESFKQLERKASLTAKEMKFVSLKKLLPKTKSTEVKHPSIFEMASGFIDDILNESNKRVDNYRMIGIERFQRYKYPEEFSIADGLELIVRCINKWSFNPNWYFKINYTGILVTESYSHFYTLKWSVPTPSYPIAQVTADIHFTIEITPMKPPPVLIEMWYRLETDRSQHNAFTKSFKESQLQTLIRRKLNAFQSFTF